MCNRWGLALLAAGLALTVSLDTPRINGDIRVSIVYST